MNRFHFITLIAISIIPFLANSQNNCNFIQDIQKYQDSAKLKRIGDSDIIDPTTFNIQTYLSYFDNIKFEKGLKFGVYFFDNFLDGNPYLYAIKENQKLNLLNKKSLYKFLNKPQSRAKNHLAPKDSDYGFIQYLFFNEMGEQFALKWHANYNAKYIVCTSEEISKIIEELSDSKTSSTDSNEEITDSITSSTDSIVEVEVSESKMFSADSINLKRFKNVSPQILVDRNSEYYMITWIENRTHSGIFKCTYRINREVPYDIVKTNEEKLLEIQIGFIY